LSNTQAAFAYHTLSRANLFSVAAKLCLPSHAEMVG
jgi:hypothetical protein